MKCLISEENLQDDGGRCYMVKEVKIPKPEKCAADHIPDKRYLYHMRIIHNPAGSRHLHSFSSKSAEARDAAANESKKKSQTNKSLISHHLEIDAVGAR